MTSVKSRILTAAIAVAALAGVANGQRIGMYPLETTDQALALAVPTAVGRSLETIDGAIFPAPQDLFTAVRTRPAFQATLDKVFSLDALVSGKLEGTAGAYTVTYTIRRGTATQNIVARGADFAALVRASNLGLVGALGLKPTALDSQELASVERALPAADVVTASTAPGVDANKAILEKAGANPWALAARALVLVGSGKNDDAITLIQPAVRAAANDPFVQASNIVALVSARKNPETKAALAAAFKINPAKPELHYLNGRYLLRSATPVTQAIAQSALDALQLALQYNPRYFEAAVSAADILEQYGNAERAVNVLTGMVARMPDDAGLHNRVLDTLLDTDRDGAVSYLQEVIKTYPDVPDTVYGLSQRLLDTDAANALVAAGEQRYPRSAVLALVRGFLLERVGSYDLAIAAYRQSVERDPSLLRANLNMAGAFSKLGRFDDAEAALKLASPSNDQKLLARMYLQTGRLDRAKTVLAKLPQTDFDVVYMNGVIALREYRADDAARLLDAASKIAGISAGQTQQVRASLTEVPDSRRLGAPKLTGDALYQFRLGQALIDAGNMLEAVSAFNRAVKTAPTDVHTLLYRGIALLATADPDDARDAFVDLAKIAPNNPMVQTYLAVAELGRGRFDLAIEAAQKAIALDKNYARGFYILGTIYFQQWALFGTASDVTAARDAFQRCVAADSNFRGLVELRLSVMPK